MKLGAFLTVGLMLQGAAWVVSAEADSPEAETPDWQMGQTDEINFGVFFEGASKLFVSTDGAVWGASEKGYFAKSDSPGTAPPGKLVDGTYVSSGYWQVGEMTSGHWGIFKDQVPKMIVTEHGEVWGAGAGGFFKPKEEEATDAKKEAIPNHFALKDGTAIVSGAWKVGETLAGHLAWYKGEELVALLHEDGDLYGAFVNGWFAADEEAERSSGELTDPLSTTVVDCQVGEWMAYTECDKRCDGGMQSRQRSIVSPPTNGGASCPYLTQSRKCNTFGCSTDCELSEWGSWADCSAPCSTGEQTRLRTVITYPSSRGKACGALSETRKCNMQKCDSKLCLTLSAGFNRLADRSDDVYFFAKEHSLESEPSYLATNPRQLWLRWNLAKQQIEEGPFDVNTGTDFVNLPDQLKGSGVDAALNLQTNKDTVFLFSTTAQQASANKDWVGKVQEWNMANDAPEGTMMELMTPNKVFSNLPFPFNQRVDEALNFQPQNATSFLFHNQRDGQSNPDKVLVLAFNAETTPANPSGAPAGEIFNMSSWSEMPEPFISHIDAAVNRGRFSYEAYFFSGSQWLLWDLAKETIVEGPYDLADHDTFKPLVESLDLCTGFDLQKIGHDSLLHEAILKTQPRPKGVVSKLVGASGMKGYADTLPERSAGQSSDHSVAAIAHDIPEIRFDNPSDVAIAGYGTEDAVAYVADTNNHAIRRIHLITRNTTTVAGGGYGMGFMDGTGATAKFRFPSGVSVVRRDGDDMPGDVVYVADEGNDAIRRVFIPKGSDVGHVLTVAGGGGKQCSSCQTFEDVLCTGCCQCYSHGFVDGLGVEAMFNKPSDVSVLYNRTAVGITANEFIYVTDKDNHAIRRVTIKPGINKGDIAGHVVTIAGGAKTVKPNETASEMVSGFNDGFGSEAQFNHPSSISALRVTPDEVSVPSYDTLYVADTHNKALRRIVMPLVATGALDADVLTTGDAEIKEEEHRKQVQEQRLETQRAHLAALTRQRESAEAQVAAEEEAVADQAELVPSAASRRLMQQVNDLGEQAQDPGTIPPIAPRYTKEGGSAPKDTPCRLPFTYGGRAYNDCTDVLAPDLGISADSFTEGDGWCPTGPGPSNEKWAPCAPAGFEPRRCVLSEWSVFEECPVTCGAGGTTRRVRSILEQGDYGCDILEETRACNTFACGAVVTVTGGIAIAGNPRGYGVAGPSGGTDLEFAPISVAAMHQDGVDIVYSAGQQTMSSSPPIHRADITPDAITMTIAGQYLGARSISLPSAEGPSTDLFATTSENNVGKMDLSLVIKCEDWMTNSLNHWDSDPKSTGTPGRSNKLTVKLKAGGALATEWNWVAYRSVKKVGYTDFKTLADPQPWKGDLVKNAMCVRQTQNTDKALYTSEECCVTKYAPELVKPCGGEYPECSPLHDKVLDQWANAKCDLEDQLAQI